MLYNLDGLGWYQFERVCQALLRSLVGAALETWGGTRDLGRDSYSSAALRYPDPEVERAGPFVFQVKFVANANAAGAKPAGPLLKGVNAEVKRIKERLASGVWVAPRYYTLLTNVTLTADMRASIESAVKSALPRCTVLSWGASEVSVALDDNPSIRLSHPQLLGLRDLTTLLERAMAKDVATRSTLAIESTQLIARVFVPTSAYRRTVGLLGNKGFAVLVGPPEMGKTATARMIALARHTMGWEAFDCRSPDDLFKVLDPDRCQIFVADDAFGSTEYRPEIAAEWAAVLDRLIDAADARHQIVWTSRPAPLNEGLRQLHIQGSARHFPEAQEVTVDASQLTVPEKAHMLYRHAKAAGLDTVGLEIIRQNARRIVDSPHFTPLRIERLVRDDLPAVAKAHDSDRPRLIKAAVERGLKEPTKAMRTSFESLDEEHRAVLIKLLDVTSPFIDLEAFEAGVEAFLGHPPTRNVRALLQEVDDHFVRFSP